ncbi:hypothetical protein AAG587_08495 [Vreelandella neptunia]|uniref:hypothetical protein n=1 Tax=Vreelandella neptunia TaxID=115551 RepID=UPI00315995DF
MDSVEQFNRQYLGDWAPDEHESLKQELAKRYHEETEAFDRTVCTGPIIDGSIRPANNYQLQAINRNASMVRGIIVAAAEDAGISREEMRRAISHYH